MTKETFDVILDVVCEQMNVSKESLLERTQRRRIVSARHILYYVCSKFELKNVYIQEFLDEEGYSIKHNTILYGRYKIADSIESNTKLRKVVDSCVSKANYMFDQMYI
jgi:chromosomal replication initiation ATPase DnaA